MAARIEFDKCGAVVGAQLRGAGANAADFLGLRLWAYQRESVSKMVLALVNGFLHSAVLPPVINAAVGEHNKALITSSHWKRQRDASTAREHNRNIHQQWQRHR